MDHYTTRLQIQDKYFYQQNIELVKQIKEMVKTIVMLTLPLDIDYIVIETDECGSRWGVMFRKTSKYDLKTSKALCRYAFETRKKVI